MKLARWWTLIPAVSLLVALLPTAAASAQSPLPASGGGPIFLPFVAKGPAANGESGLAPSQPAPSEPASPEETPDVAPVLLPPEETPNEKPAPADNPASSLLDTDGPLFAPNVRADAPLDAASLLAPAWNVVGDYTVSSRLGVGVEPPTYLGDFRHVTNGMAQVRATNGHEGDSAGAAVVAATGHGFAAVLQTYGANFAGGWSGIPLRRWAHVRADSNLNGMIVSTGGADPLVLGTNNEERVRVTADGNVGIGTDTPSSKLTVFNRIGISVLRLLGPNAAHAGARVHFGDGFGVFIAESHDGELEIGADEVNFTTPRIEIDGVSPIIVRRMENINGSASTGIPTAYYKCVATSWAAQYNVRESDTGINAVWVYDDGSGSWRVEAQMHSEVNHDLPDVDVLCFREELVDYIGDDFVWDPD